MHIPLSVITRNGGLRVWLWSSPPSPLLCEYPTRRPCRHDRSSPRRRHAL